jgi:hypothetical protein
MEPEQVNLDIETDSAVKDKNHITPSKDNQSAQILQKSSSNKQLPKD